MSRTRQGTPWGYEADGIKRVRCCLHDDCLYDSHVDPYATTREVLQAGVREFLRPGVPFELWLALPERLKGRLCAEHAIEWRSKLERWFEEARLDDVCGECAGLRGTHAWNCSERLARAYAALVRERSGG